LNPPSTVPLIKLSTSTSELSITKCKFDKSTGNALSHSLIDMNGGKLTITSTDFSSYAL
jgi:hypothetical protein